jgi:uncharacterized protein with ParB-like and HNH nuclease domain/predicted transport protein
MKATEAKLLAFLKKSPQFVIPIYQRTYNWTERECRQLWEDIIRTGELKEVSAHFVGSIVYVEKGLYSVSSQSPLLVIDGQQRLTTMTLLIEALARAVGDSEPVDGFSAKKLRNYYLLNPEESGERHYKLVLSQTDRESLIAILNGQPQPKEVSLRVQANFELFEQWIANEKNNLEAVCEGIAKLVIVDISLDRDQDNPQLIFESLNSTGRELSQADLIRNFILMGLDPELQTKLYERYWRPMELDFGQEAYATQFDAFMRHYLTVKTGDIPNVREVYEAFKSFARSDRVTSTEALVADIREYSRYYCAFALGAETNPELKSAFEDIRGLKVDVSYPFLLELYRDYESGVLAKENFPEIARLIESYVFRRSICAIPTNSHNKTFATVAKSIQKERYLESVQAHFLALPSYRRFPRDEEFIRELQVRDLYNFPRRMYFLRRLENEGRKEPVPVEEFTIEHIRQNENLSVQWRADLGPEWSRIQQTYLHTLGNLTLTGYNSEYSDRSFAEKRDMQGGFAKSPLHLNDMLRDCPAWTESTIIERAGRLAKQAVNVWNAPSLDPATLASYQPKQTAISKYGIDDHPQLRGGPIRAIFDALRREVLAIDPAVTEEFKKYYVAYKAETNFVDVVPQVRRLVLSLNIDFHTLDDPRRIARDVTGLGKWGNGDVNIPLATVDDLPYVMGLVRQAFDQQMANGGDA